MGILSLTKYECPPEVFAEISKSLLLAGKSIRFNAVGDSMFPFIHNGDLVVIEPAILTSLKIGDIIFYQDISGHCLLHRVIRKRRLDGNFEFQIQADNILKPDGWVPSELVLGRLTRFFRNNEWIKMDSLLTRIANVLILVQLRLGLTKYDKFRSGRNYFRYLPLICRFF